MGAEEHGIDILRVQEIRSFEQPTRTAGAPPHVLGVSKLRESARSGRRRSSAVRPAARATLISLAPMPAVGAATLFGAALFSRAITRPLGQALHAARAVAAADLAEPAPARRSRHS